MSRDIETIYDRLTTGSDIKRDLAEMIAANTLCPMCNNIVPYNEAGLLCEECRMDYGHALMEEL